MYWLARSRMRAKSPAATALGSTNEPPMPRQHAAGLKERLGCVQVDPSSGHQADLGKRASKRLSGKLGRPRRRERL